MFTNYKAKHPLCDVGKLLMCNSTVSSKMLQAMAQKEGFRYEETLTGFKWLGHKILSLKQEGYVPLFAFEQAIGYMIGDVCPDKDGVRTAAIFAEMANHCYSKNSTLFAHLESLYQKYGYFSCKDSYFFCDVKNMKTLFSQLTGDGKNYPSTMGKYKVSRVRDLMKPGYDDGQPDKKPVLPLGSSPMITFFFENGAIITLRGSGTEPKLKYYAEYCGERDTADQTLDDMIQEMTTDFLKPDINTFLK